MFAYATMQGEAQPLVLAGVVMVSMMIACSVSGVAGAMIPLTLKRLGADPATASSIFLTTASDVARVPSYSRRVFRNLSFWGRIVICPIFGS
jgi:magnesium transporter